MTTHPPRRRSDPWAASRGSWSVHERSGPGRLPAPTKGFGAGAGSCGALPSSTTDDCAAGCIQEANCSAPLLRTPRPNGSRGTQTGPSRPRIREFTAAWSSSPACGHCYELSNNRDLFRSIAWNIWKPVGACWPFPSATIPFAETRYNSRSRSGDSGPGKIQAGGHGGRDLRTAATPVGGQFGTPSDRGSGPIGETSPRLPGCSPRRVNSKAQRRGSRAIRGSHRRVAADEPEGESDPFLVTFRERRGGQSEVSVDLDFLMPVNTANTQD